MAKLCTCCNASKDFFNGCSIFSLMITVFYAFIPFLALVFLSAQTFVSALAEISVLTEAFAPSLPSMYLNKILQIASKLALKLFI